ncbi:MAG: Rho termination factor N-terminal domain-containing protein [Planctomycetota bacterium]
MPGAWSKKDEKQYSEIKQSNLDRGIDEDRAEEIAARTVNKTRRQEGRTPNRTSEGSGNPNTPLDQRSKRELYNRATDLDIAGRSKMDKSELVAAIRDRQ